MKGGVNNEEAKRLSQQERNRQNIDVEQKEKEEGTGNKEKMKDYKFLWQR